MRVLVLASVNVDTTLRVLHLPAPGETVLSVSDQVGLGGKGANQAIAAALAGATTRAIAMVGSDEGADLVRTGFARAGVIPHLHGSRAATGRAVVMVDAAGENSIVVTSGANALWSKAALDNASRRVHNVRVVATTLEVPLEVIEFVLKEAKKHQVKTVLNVAPIDNNSRKDVLNLISNVDVLVANAEEARVLLETTESDTTLLALQLLKLNVESAVVSSDKGAAWATCKDEDTTSGFVPSPQVQVVDTSGAGDVLTGTLAANLNMHLQEAVSRAVKAASQHVSYPGASPRIPTEKHTTERFKP